MNNLNEWGANSGFSIAFTALQQTRSTTVMHFSLTTPPSKYYEESFFRSQGWVSQTSWAGRWSRFLSQSGIDNNFQTQQATHLRARRISNGSICARFTWGSSKRGQLHYSLYEESQCQFPLLPFCGPQKQRTWYRRLIFPVLKGHWVRTY
jgi:hypothetical protein